MKDILLISSGLSPQIITETLCYYATESTPILFDEIHVITGTTGKKLIMENLLGGDGYYDKFLNDYELDKKLIKFSEENIHVLIDSNGNPMDDLLTINQNKAAINQIFELVDYLTQDENSRLITSIAGGRKTMSVIVGQAMQFYAREQDIIIHVVIDEKLLRNDFYYPTPYKKIVEINGEKIDYSKVKLHLDELPFIRLRSIVGPLITENDNSSLLDLVSEAQSQISALIKPPSISIDLKGKTLSINDYSILLPPKNLAFYSVMLKLQLDDYKEENQETGFIDIYQMIELDFLESFLEFYTCCYGPNNIYVVKESEKINNESNRRSSFDIEWLKQTRSKVNHILKKSLPPNIYHFCEIASIRDYGNTKYGVLNSKKYISINQR